MVEKMRNKIESIEELENIYYGPDKKKVRE